MAIHLATRTLAAIDAAIRKDGGNLFRYHLGLVMPTAADAYDHTASEYRAHLGASLLGKECARAIWYSWRWWTLAAHESRMYRLFNRGHLEEPRFVAMLRASGVQVWQYDENGKQFRISDHDGFFGGSIDGVVLGVPDAPDVPLLSEFKTHNQKSFNKLVADGVIKSKLQHYVQTILYMGYRQLAGALYMAVNKDDDELYAELVSFNPETFNRFRQRAAGIIASLTPPPRIKEDPQWYQCRFCDHRAACHKGAPALKTCRSCVNVTRKGAGMWGCALTGASLTKDQQLAGCNQHREIR